MKRQLLALVFGLALSVTANAQGYYPPPFLVRPPAYGYAPPPPPPAFYWDRAYRPYPVWGPRRFGGWRRGWGWPGHRGGWGGGWGGWRGRPWGWR
jgi:hypothetical protein